MPPRFDHEQLKAYQESLHFVAWVGPYIEELPAKLSARDQLDRASTSIVLNLAEGNGKRSHAERCRFFDIARGSAVECAACLDVLVAREKMAIAQAEAGKAILHPVVMMTAGLIAHFSKNRGTGVVEEQMSTYGIVGVSTPPMQRKIKRTK